MKISKETIEILKHFSSINHAIVISPGSKLRTVDVGGTMFGEADIAENFPKEISIYDIKEFLSVVSLFDDPDFEFDDTKATIKESDGGASAKYLYASKALIAHPGEDDEITMPDPEVSFNLSSRQLDKAKKAGALMSLPTMSFVFESGKGKLRVHDAKNPDSNVFESDLSGVEATVDGTVDFTKLPVMPGDYKVEASSHKIVRLTGDGILYYMAPEDSTKLGG